MAIAMPNFENATIEEIKDIVLYEGVADYPHIHEKLHFTFTLKDLEALDGCSCLNKDIMQFALFLMPCERRSVHFFTNFACIMRPTPENWFEHVQRCVAADEMPNIFEKKMLVFLSTFGCTNPPDELLIIVERPGACLIDSDQEIPTVNGLDPHENGPIITLIFGGNLHVLHHFFHTRVINFLIGAKMYFAPEKKFRMVHQRVVQRSLKPEQHLFEMLRLTERIMTATCRSTIINELFDGLISETEEERDKNCEKYQARLSKQYQQFMKNYATPAAQYALKEGARIYRTQGRWMPSLVEPNRNRPKYHYGTESFDPTTSPLNFRDMLTDFIGYHQYRREIDSIDLL